MRSGLRGLFKSKDYWIIGAFLAAYLSFYALGNLLHAVWGWQLFPTWLALLLALLIVTPIIRKSYGTTVNSLVAVLGEEISSLIARLRTLKGKYFEVSFFDFSSKAHAGLSQELEDTKRLQLGSTLNPEILNKVSTLLRQPETHQLIEVNLANGRIWWSTRLYLLAALADDFANARYLVFLVGEDEQPKRFLGIATPRVTRQACGTQFPILVEMYNEAYRESILTPDAGVEERIKQVYGLMQNFSNMFEPHVRDEKDLKVYVTAKEVQDWLGENLHRDTIEWPGDHPSAAVLRRIVTHPTSFVPLVRAGELVCLVDRRRLVERVAFGSLQNVENKCAG